MNYFAHGLFLIDRPYALAGSALPDWLSASDRRARLRPQRLGPGDLADGVRRHLADDLWFHQTPAFRGISGGITRRLRATDPDPCTRSSFFGHILTEMLLDAALIRARPGALDAYYEALDRVDPVRVVRDAATWLSGPPRRLRWFIDLFREHRFLHGYLDDDGLLARLRGVGRRTGLRLPRGLPGVLPAARATVYARADDLMENHAAF